LVPLLFSATALCEDRIRAFEGHGAKLGALRALTGKTVGGDQDFESFLREWGNERIWAVEDFLDDHDQQYMAERRAVELIQLATEKGYSVQLTDAVKPYGSVLLYVRNLFWKANFNARSR
jgi:hypothetical protein